MSSVGSLRPVAQATQAAGLSESNMCFRVSTFDGGNQPDPFLVETSGRSVEWAPMCPEIEAGLGVPGASMARCWAPAGIAVHAVHPGWVDTPSVRSSIPRFWRVMQSLWARTLFTGVTRLFSMRVDVAGAEAVRRGPLFLFSRHASRLDTLLPAVFAAHPYTLRLGHVMKRELLWDPCLDIVGQRTRNAFVRRGSDARDEEIALLRQLAAAIEEHDGVLLFPERTRFSPAKRERALAHLVATKQFARLERAKHFQYVLPPRRGGALALLETRPDVDVAFLAHAGFEGTASLNEIWRGAHRPHDPSLLLAGAELGDPAGRGEPGRVARCAVGTDRCVDRRACQLNRHRPRKIRRLLGPRTRSSV